MARYLLTHSLLSSWLYAMKENPNEDMTTEADPMEKFVAVLNQAETPPNAAIINGITFENLVTAVLRGTSEFYYSEMNEKTKEIRNYRINPNDHKWYDAASRVTGIIGGGILQHRASKVIEASGLTLVLYGRLDCLKAGEIYDIKFSKGYDRGKYISSTQHPTYLELLPEAQGFTYIVSNGSEVWTERYRRDEASSILPIISDFLNWMQTMDFLETYKEKWLAK